MAYLFRRSFGQKDGLTIWIFDQHRHHASREVEGNLIQFLELLYQVFLMKIRTIQNCRIKQVLESSLEVADEIAIEKYFIRFTPGNIAVPLKDNPVFGERAGLVCTEHVHAAEVLDGVETLDDHLLTAHGKRALGEADGNNHGQHLRGQSNGHGHRKEKCSFPIVLCKSVDEEDQWHHDGHELNHEPCETAEALVETCRRFVLCDGTCHRAEIGVDSRHDYYCRRRSTLNARTHEAY